MTKMTQAEYDAKWNALPCDPATVTMRYTYLCGTDALWGISPTRNDPVLGAAWGILVEHPDQRNVDAVDKCYLYILTGTPPIGWTANNVITFQGNNANTRDPVTCNICGLSGKLIGGTFVVGAT